MGVLSPIARSKRAAGRRPYAELLKLLLFGDLDVVAKSRNFGDLLKAPL